MSDTFVTQVDISLAEKIKSHLLEDGYVLSNVPYSIFSAKKKGCSVTFYQSGKLVVQGSEKNHLIQFYLEPEILKNFTYSYPNIDIDKTPRIGVDEAGKGDFFGPLCIAGVYADSNGIEALIKNGVKDSKTLIDKTILKLAKIIKEISVYECIIIYPAKYNELYGKFNNLNTLLAWAHATIIDKLYKKTGCKNAHIDQFAGKNVVENAVKSKNIDVHLSQSHKGESDPVIAAASILARESFVQGIEKLSTEYEIILPKGASKQVITAGKNFISKYGVEKLPLVAKTHFKTASDLLI